MISATIRVIKDSNSIDISVTKTTIPQNAWTPINIKEPTTGVEFRFDIVTCAGWNTPQLDRVDPTRFNIFLPKAGKTHSYPIRTPGTAEQIGKLLKSTLERYNELYSSKSA